MRFHIQAALGVMALGLATGAAEASVSDKECRVQSDVVMEIVAARQDGSAADAAVTQVAGGLKGEGAKYQSVVPALVEWVYALPDAQMGPEVGKAWVDACTAS